MNAWDCVRELLCLTLAVVLTLLGLGLITLALLNGSPVAAVAVTLLVGAPTAMLWSRSYAALYAWPVRR